MSNHDQSPMLVPTYSSQLPSSPTPPGMGYGEEIYKQRDLQEYLYIIMKRKWLIICTFIAIITVAALYIYTRTPIFRSTATLQITQDNPGSQVGVDDKMSYLTGGSLDQFQETQYKILQSESLAKRVIRALDLQHHPDFRSLDDKNPAKTATQVNNKMVDCFLRKLKVTPLRNSYLVQVSFQSPDKLLTQDVVNAISEEYINLSIDRRNESFILVRKWLNKQLHAMGAKVQEAQKKLYKFGQKTDIYTLEDKDNVIVQKFIDLSALLTKAQAEKMAKEAQYQQIKQKGPDAPLIVNNPVIAALRQQWITQKAKISGMRKVFRSGHPELQSEEANLAEIKGRLQAEVKRLEESVKADYEAANRTEKLLKESFAGQKRQMAKLQDNLTEFQILKRDAQTNEQLYQALLARVKEANIAGTMVPATVAVIDPGRIPDAPFAPRTRRNMTIAVFFALTFSLGLAFILEHLDNTIKSPSDLESACELPSLGILPLLTTNGRMIPSGGKKSIAPSVSRYLPWVHRHNQNNGQTANLDLIAFDEPHSLLSNSIGHVYSSIMLSTSGRPPRVLLITSPNPSEGKSMLASNLATFCAHNDHQVLLIDGDMRNPRLNKIFGLDSQPGLSNYLTGSTSLEEILRPTLIPNLTLISAGPHPPSPVKLLHSEPFRELLEELRQRFHHIIIDTPPVLGFADARFISLLVDGVLLVTRYQSTNKNAGRLASQLLNQSPILGGVLNGVDSHGQAYKGYYYHYQYYKYYHTYQDPSN